MKIVHICLGAFFPDGYSYQENMLPKYHKIMGHDVTVMAGLDTFDENGKTTYLNSGSEYINENGVKVIRLNYRGNLRFAKKFKSYAGVGETLEKEKPDLLFIHNCQFLSIGEVAGYLKKHPQVTVYVDNHADFSNSATNPVSRTLLHGLLWKSCARKIEPFTKKFYGVLPARVDFLKNVYGMPAEKCELLVMGADDELVETAAKPEVREEIRRECRLAPDDFVVMTGGKIDAFKTQTLLLMEAVRRIDNPKLKLIVFGSVTPELKEQVDALTDGERVQYVGWIQSKDSYRWFAAADLVVFPGRHSVFWEQVAAQGIPMLCKKWDGTTHVDLGGNVRFLTQDSVDEIEQELRRLIENPVAYDNMKQVAVEKGMKVFSYRDIAARSIGGKK